jgi:hypothetical protein
MAYSLTWLREVLEEAGLKVAEQPDWQNRGHGDMGPIRGVICHHTGSVGKAILTQNMPTLGVVTQGRADLAGPLAHLCLGRDGTFYVIAAGRCYHAGPGNWRGVTSGNSNFIGIEAENTGQKSGEYADPWPVVQMDAYRRGVAAILKKIGADAAMCCGHKEYRLPVGYKDDPDFDMDAFRCDVAAIMAGAAPPPPPIKENAAADSGLIDRILGVAASSDIARYQWKGRGVAPAGYIKGMALVFARACARLARMDPAAVEMAKAETPDAARDALAWYRNTFSACGMKNDVAGRDTLRHLFVLLIGLGMRESSGRCWEGRDRSASNAAAETAEAGLFQASYNARKGSPLMGVLFQMYCENPSGFLEVFKEGVMCSERGLENYGSGDGEKFQRLSKECPAFAAEFTAVGLRAIRSHWGPINRREAEIRPECDAMLLEVQKIVDGAGDGRSVLL